MQYIQRTIKISTDKVLYFYFEIIGRFPITQILILCSTLIIIIILFLFVKICCVSSSNLSRTCGSNDIYYLNIQQLGCARTRNVRLCSGQHDCNDNNMTRFCYRLTIAENEHSFDIEYSS